MAVAFRSKSELAYGSRSNSTITKPAGVVAGDVLVFALTIEANTTPPDLTAYPSGLVPIFEDQTSGPTSGAYYVHYLYYKVAGGSEPASYAFTHPTYLASAAVVAYSGVDNTTPLDATPTAASGTGTTATATGLTTVTSGAMLVFERMSWDGGVSTAPTGMAERVDSVVNYFADQVQTTAGATGTKSHGSGNSAAFVAWQAYLVPLRPAGAGGTNVTVTGVTATSTATAIAPTVSTGASATPPVATATALALAPGVSTAGGVSVTAPVATATALALAPTVGAGLTITSGVATGSATAYAPSLSAGITLTAPRAQTLGAALAPLVSSGSTVTAPRATATAQALPATFGSPVTIAPPAATAFALAPPPAVLAGSANVNITATVAIATATALTPFVTTPGMSGTFNPPTIEQHSGDYFFGRYGIPVGMSVVKRSGVFTVVPIPWLGEIADLTDGIDFFLGGHVYEVDDAVASGLVAAGFVVTPNDLETN